MTRTLKNKARVVISSNSTVNSHNDYFLCTIMIWRRFNAYSVKPKASFKLWNTPLVRCPPLGRGDRVARPPVENVQRPRCLRKYTSHPNYRNCKVDISRRQGHSGRMCVKPLLFHYTIRTCDVKRRSHADNIIGFLYGRGKSMTPCSPRERWRCLKGRRKTCWRVHVGVCICDNSRC